MSHGVGMRVSQNSPSLSCRTSASRPLVRSGGGRASTPKPSEFLPAEDQLFSIGFLTTPGGAQANGRIDQSDVREALREIAEQLTCRRVSFFGKQADIVGASAKALK